MKRIAILGSTGSIGINTLKVVSRFPDRFSVVGLSANSNIELLYQQIKDIRPRMVSVGNPEKAQELQKRLNSALQIYTGQDGLNRIVQDKYLDLVVIAISGSFALWPLLEAIKHKKTIALANKEALVMAGRPIMEEAKKYKVNIIPIDSEQSAIFQCLKGQNANELKRVYLTASGGPVLDKSLGDFARLKPEDVLIHPKWNMGKKITIDSATFMNKGLEIIEAMHLFSIDVDKIEVVIHRQAIIHSMVEFIDGTIIAQLGITDMQLPIQYALSFPQRWPSEGLSLDISRLGSLTFESPDFARFPCLGLALEAAKSGGLAPAVLNAANEEAVEAFLNKRLSFKNIARVIQSVLEVHRPKPDPSLDEILDADNWARQEAKKLVATLKLEPQFQGRRI